MRTGKVNLRADNERKLGYLYASSLVSCAWGAYSGY